MTKHFLWISLLLFLPLSASATGILSPDTSDTPFVTFNPTNSLVSEASCTGGQPHCYVGYFFGPNNLGLFLGGGGEIYDGMDINSAGGSYDIGAGASPNPPASGDYHAIVVDEEDNGEAVLGTLEAQCDFMSGAGYTGGNSAYQDCLSWLTANGVTPVESGTFTYPLATTDPLGVNGTLSTGFFGLGQVLGVVFASILVGFIALLGLGFGWRYIKKYITGRTF